MNRLSAYLAAALLSGGAVVAGEGGPQRVVSMNLCTDQLAMMLAAPGQLVSVSDVSLDPLVSSLTEQAATYQINHGMAEQIYLMRPDLVVAGAYTNATTIAMLRRFDIPVVTFTPARSLDEIRDRITEMGEVLNRQEAAAEMVAQFDARLATLAARAAESPRAVLYYANGYTLGSGTLAGQILAAAGFINAAAEEGYTAGSRMPLEVLAITDPDLVVTSETYPGGSRSEEILAHPVVQSFRRTGASVTVTNHDWICGTPAVLNAVGTLSEARQALLDSTE